MRTTSCLISGIFYNYIGLVILEVAKGKEDDISLVDPNLIVRGSATI